MSARSLAYLCRGCNDVSLLIDCAKRDLRAQRCNPDAVNEPDVVGRLVLSRFSLEVDPQASADGGEVAAGEAADWRVILDVAVHRVELQR